MYHVLLYYKFIRMKHPEAEVKRHQEVCKALQLKGRILINADGINGTVGGTPESIRLYQDYMNAHKYFNNIDFKVTPAETNPFPKMQVKLREEIITTEAMHEIDLCRRGKHIDRDTFHDWLERGEEMVIIDMRNDYEWEVGRFRNAIRPPVTNFKEIKDQMEYYNQFKGKKIVMYCTGGIRCEPASSLFLARGFDKDNLYQLEGGIVKYAEKYANDGHFEGKCFTFDDRMVLPVNTTESAVITGKCIHCQTPTDLYRNCANKHCNKLFLGCDSCVESTNCTCKEECKAIIQDPTNIRPMRANQQVREVAHA